MTVKEFFILSDVASNQEDVKAQLESLPKPLFVCGVRTPDTLNDLLFGVLAMLQGISTPEEFIMVPCRELLKLTDDQVMGAKAEDILGFCMWTGKEVERINKLFASTSVKPTQEEIQAGIESLQFDTFNLMDNYATRMRITNHEDVERVPWVRIHRCMKIDSQRAQFQRRLQKICSEKK